MLTVWFNNIDYFNSDYKITYPKLLLESFTCSVFYGSCLPGMILSEHLKCICMAFHHIYHTTDGLTLFCRRGWKIYPKKNDYMNAKYIYSNTSIKREEWWWHALHKCYLYNIMLYIWYLHALCNQRYLDVIMNFAATLWNQRTKIQNAILTVKLLEKIVTVLCHVFLGCCSCRIDLGNMLLTAITSIPAPK